MDGNDDNKSKIFKLIQGYLKPYPVIIWGSGATIPFGLPSMEELKTKLGLNSRGNLENILSELSNEKELEKYSEKIFTIINQKDKEFREKLSKENLFGYLNDIFLRFYESNPQCLNIITTNYDCTLEYLFSYYSYPYSDGFSGREFSEFSKDNFKDKKHINLLKVHGSLRWFEGRYHYYNQNMQAIYPNKHKFEHALKEPFRTLITKSDEKILKSKSFLVVGFGFNDEHLTPKLEEVIEKDDVKTVIVTKNATDNAKKKLENAKNIILIEESEKEKQTTFSYKEDRSIKKLNLEGNFWKLKEFKSILKGTWYVERG